MHTGSRRAARMSARTGEVRDSTIDRGERRAAAVCRLGEGRRAREPIGDPVTPVKSTYAGARGCLRVRVEAEHRAGAQAAVPAAVCPARGGSAGAWNGPLTPR